MKTPHSIAALELLKVLLPHCREHGGQLSSCVALSEALVKIEAEAIDTHLEERRAKALERATNR